MVRIQIKSHNIFKSGLSIWFSLSFKSRWIGEGEERKFILNCQKDVWFYPHTPSLIIERDFLSNVFAKSCLDECFHLVLWAPWDVLEPTQPEYFFSPRPFCTLAWLRILGPKPAPPLAFVCFGKTLLKNWGNSSLQDLEKWVLQMAGGPACWPH